LTPTVRGIPSLLDHNSSKRTAQQALPMLVVICSVKSADGKKLARLGTTSLVRSRRDSPKSATFSISRLDSKMQLSGFRSLFHMRDNRRHTLVALSSDARLGNMTTYL